MNTEELGQIFNILDEMPEAETKYISKDPERCIMDLQLWKMCKHKGDMTAWEKLKLLRK